jgi:archaemetzincin
VSSLLLLSVLLAGLPARAEPTPSSEPVVALLPLGEVSPAVLEWVTRELEARLRVRVRREPRRELPKEAFYAPRRRWRAEKLLEAIDANPPKGAWKVVAITDAEISTTKDDIPDWRVAGLGSLQGLSCVLSTYIYRKHSKTEATLLRRMGDLAVHEFGHTLGFDHCETDGCVMADAKGMALESADQSSGHYCARCLGGLSPEDRARVKAPAREGGAKEAATPAPR